MAVRLRNGRIFCSWPCAPRPMLPTSLPMAVGCTGVAFSAPSRAPRALRAPCCAEILQWLVGCAGVEFSAPGHAPCALAPEVAHNDCNGCRLRRGRIFWSWPCTLRPWCPYCPNFFNAARRSRGRMLCSWPCVVGPPAAHICSNGCRLRRGRILCYQPCAPRLAPQAARNTSTHCRLRKG